MIQYKCLADDMEDVDEMDCFFQCHETEPLSVLLDHPVAQHGQVCTATGHDMHEIQTRALCHRPSFPSLPCLVTF